MFRLGKIKSAAESYLSQYRTSSPASYAAAQQAVGGLLIADGLIGIDHPLGGNKRRGIFGSLAGVIVGLFFIFGTGFIGNLMGINKLTATTAATVVSVSQPARTGNDSGSSCTATAKYIVNGKEYNQTASSGTSSTCSLTAGQKIDINYDPNNPAAWAYDLATIKTVFKIFPIVGVIVTVTSLFTFVIRLLSIIFGWKLLKSGRALAKTLPAGTDLSTVKNEVSQNFAQYLFGMGAGKIQPQVTGQYQTPSQAVQQPQPLNNPPQQPQQNQPQNNPPAPPQVPPAS